MSGDGRLAGAGGDLMLFVTGAVRAARSSGPVPDDRHLAGAGGGLPDRRRGARRPVGAADADGEITAVRDDARASRTVSTVDTLGHAAGQVVTVMALAGQAAGRTGHYGGGGRRGRRHAAVRATR